MVASGVKVLTLAIIVGIGTTLFGEFLNAAADRKTVSPDRLANSASCYVVQVGAVIPAALITGIRSDLPGQVTAQVTEHVYDSPTGKYLLASR